MVLTQQGNIHLCLIMGMLMQLAAHTAVKGTRRPTRGGSLTANLFSPRATTTAPDVAVTYDLIRTLRRDQDISV